MKECWKFHHLHTSEKNRGKDGEIDNIFVKKHALTIG